MTLIHHVVTGDRPAPIVFVHGFGCSHTDWAAQVAHLSPNHQTIAVDLRGHGASPGSAAACSIERYGADVAEVMRALSLSPAVLVGHSMGCRVVTEAALQAPAHTAGVILLDGSQFAASMGDVLQARFAEPDGYRSMVTALFAEMFTARSDPATVSAVAARAQDLPPAIGEKMLADMQRYDVGRLAASLGSLRTKVMAIQSTYTNDQRQRQPMRAGQTTPYLDMLRANLPGASVEVIAETGHFPQLDAPDRTNALIDNFMQGLHPD